MSFLDHIFFPSDDETKCAVTGIVIKTICVHVAVGQRGRKKSRNPSKWKDTLYFITLIN